MSEDVSVDCDFPKTVRSFLFFVVDFGGRCIIEVDLEAAGRSAPEDAELIELHPEGELLLGIEEPREVILLPSEAKSAPFLI